MSDQLKIISDAVKELQKEGWRHAEIMVPPPELSSTRMMGIGMSDVAHEAQASLFFLCLNFQQKFNMDNKKFLELLSQFMESQEGMMVKKLLRMRQKHGTNVFHQ